MRGPSCCSTRAANEISRTSFVRTSTSWNVPSFTKTTAPPSGVKVNRVRWFRDSRSIGKASQSSSSVMRLRRRSPLMASMSVTYAIHSPSAEIAGRAPPEGTFVSGAISPVCRSSRMICARCGSPLPRSPAAPGPSVSRK